MRPVASHFEMFFDGNYFLAFIGRFVFLHFSGSNLAHQTFQNKIFFFYNNILI